MSEVKESPTEETQEQVPNILWYVNTTIVVPFDELIVHDGGENPIKPYEAGWTPEETGVKLRAGEVFVSLSEMIDYADGTEHFGFWVEGGRVRRG